MSDLIHYRNKNEKGGTPSLNREASYCGIDNYRSRVCCVFLSLTRTDIKPDAYIRCWRDRRAFGRPAVVRSVGVELRVRLFGAST